jgi:hypothetical protein
VIADIEANGAIAVTLVRPTTYQAVQVTGTVEWIGELTPADQARVDAHLEGFLGEVMQVGMTRDTARLLGERLVAVRVAVEQAFAQTPGPGAGSAL